MVREIRSSPQPNVPFEPEKKLAKKGGIKKQKSNTSLPKPSGHTAPSPPKKGVSFHPRKTVHVIEINPLTEVAENKVEYSFPETTIGAQRTATKMAHLSSIGKEQVDAPKTGIKIIDPEEIKEVVDVHHAKRDLRLGLFDKKDIDELKEDLDRLKRKFNKLNHKIETLFTPGNEIFKTHTPAYQKWVQDDFFQKSLNRAKNEYLQTIASLEKMMMKKSDEIEIQRLQEKIKTLREGLEGIKAKMGTPRSLSPARQKDLDVILARHQAEIEQLEKVLASLKS